MQQTRPEGRYSPQLPFHRFQRNTTFLRTGHVGPGGLTRAEAPWVDGRVPNGYWDRRENRVCYLQWLGNRCGFHNPNHWYGLRRHHFQKNYGGGLLRNVYRSSVQTAVRELMPGHDWHPWLFGGAPRGYWKDRNNRTDYMDWLGEQLGLKMPADWYSVTGADFFSHHGGGLLNNEFNGSVQAVLNDYMPHFPWKAWLFASVPQSYWTSAEHRQSYLVWLGTQLGFVTESDWKKLHRDHFHHNGGSGLFSGHYHGSIQKALAELPREATAS